MTDASHMPRPPADAARTAPVPAPRQRLAIRLAWLTAGFVLLTQALFVVPALLRQRNEWLDRRLTEAELAAVSAAEAPDGTVDRATRDALLRLAGAEAIGLERPGQTEIILAPTAAMPPARRLDLPQESLLGAVSSTLGSLLSDRGDLISVQAASPLRPDATIVATLREHDLHRVLLHNLQRIGSIRLCIAIVVGVFMYIVMLVVLVRPIRRLGESIAAFRADPERSLPLDETGFTRFRGDEIGAAARDFAELQRELRAALWRNARLAAVGAAMAKVNHDLRGILSPAMLTAERLQMSRDPSVKRAGDVLVRAVERAADLTSRTLEFASETPDSRPRQRVALHPAVEDAAEQVRAACPKLSVANHVVPDMEIEADRESIVRVFGNLLRNSGEADARRASVTAVIEAQDLVIVVSDDGPGLPEAVRAALFRPFVAGARRGSTGLGLAIVHDLVRAHGGEVVLLDTGPGGTQFRLTLPRRGMPLATRSAASAG